MHDIQEHARALLGDKRPNKLGLFTFTPDEIGVLLDLVALGQEYGDTIPETQPDCVVCGDLGCEFCPGVGCAWPVPTTRRTARRSAR